MHVRDVPATINCDKEGCEYSKVVAMGRVKAYKDRCCPNCGSVLITEEDVLVADLVIAAIGDNDCRNETEDSIVLKINSAMRLADVAITLIDQNHPCPEYNPGPTDNFEDAEFDDLEQPDAK